MLWNGQSLINNGWALKLLFSKATLWRVLSSALLSLLVTHSVFAAEQKAAEMSALDQNVEPGWQQISTATATWMWLDIYDATLYANEKKLPERFLKDDVALKLNLCYLKPIGSDIFIEGANAALPNVLTPELGAEVERLHQAYQSVVPGDCYTLEYRPTEGTALKLNDKPLFHSRQAGFKAVYFGIWLGDNPLSERLKNQLLASQITQ